jgi:hypothetical protein
VLTIRIRIRIHGLDDQGKNYRLNKQKNSTIVSGEAFSPQKKNIKHFKHEIS